MSIEMNLDIAQRLFIFAALALICIRLPVLLRQRRLQPIANQSDWPERIGHGMAVCGMLLTPLLASTDSLFAHFNWSFSPLMALMGAGVMLLSLWMLCCSQYDLAGHGTTTWQLHTGQRLVKSGIYQHIRHPMYAAFWLWGLAQAMMLQNWLTGFSGLATFAVLYSVRMPNEERMLLKHFGAEYLAYMHSTGRILPKWQWHEEKLPV
ncbi:protein-S-isoprenylcysteine O-methyltransferase [Chitinibacter sp. SCUT-21]|uniref:protein-S-isoprenylcysteine O-methyltransferase n=1 Tax=Chitinibacter sp. SCUT-21 TaxID=2970891 RepID=UPI0035A58325